LRKSLLRETKQHIKDRLHATRQSHISDRLHHKEDSGHKISARMMLLFNDWDADPKQAEWLLLRQHALTDTAVCSGLTHKLRLRCGMGDLNAMRCSPNCNCCSLNKPETQEHLLLCPAFTHERERFLQLIQVVAHSLPEADRECAIAITSRVSSNPSKFLSPLIFAPTSKSLHKNILKHNHNTKTTVPILSQESFLSLQPHILRFLHFIHCARHRIIESRTPPHCNRLPPPSKDTPQPRKGTPTPIGPNKRQRTITEFTNQIPPSHSHQPNQYNGLGPLNGGGGGGCVGAGVCGCVGV